MSLVTIIVPPEASNLQNIWTVHQFRSLDLTNYQGSMGLYDCDRCGLRTKIGLLHSRSCYHILCRDCLNLFVWSETTHFFCNGENCEPYCPLCKASHPPRPPCIHWPEQDFRRSYFNSIQFKEAVAGYNMRKRKQELKQQRREERVQAELRAAT